MPCDRVLCVGHLNPVKGVLTDSSLRNADRWHGSLLPRLTRTICFYGPPEVERRTFLTNSQCSFSLYCLWRAMVVVTTSWRRGRGRCGPSMAGLRVPPTMVINVPDRHSLRQSVGRCLEVAPLATACCPYTVFHSKRANVSC